MFEELFHITLVLGDRQLNRPITSLTAPTLSDEPATRNREAWKESKQLVRFGFRTNQIDRMSIFCATFSISFVHGESGSLLIPDRFSLFELNIEDFVT